MPLSANAITDVATVRAMLKLLSAVDDSIIENMINGVSAHFENYCNSKFINQAQTEVLDGTGEPYIFTNFSPISSLTEIKFYVDSTPEVMTLTDFSYNAKAGMIRYKSGSFSWEGESSAIPLGFQNVQIKYTAGYGAAIANLPDDIKLAAVMQAEFLYKKISADFSTTFGEESEVKIDEALSPQVKELLRAYKRTQIR